MTITTIERKYGKELAVGDVIVITSRQCKTITSIDEHGKQDDARIIRSGSWGMTVFNSEYFRRLSDGTWISSHLWWNHPLKVQK